MSLKKDCETSEKDERFHERTFETDEFGRRIPAAKRRRLNSPSPESDDERVKKEKTLQSIKDKLSKPSNNDTKSKTERFIQSQIRSAVKTETANDRSNRDGKSRHNSSHSQSKVSKLGKFKSEITEFDWIADEKELTMPKHSVETIELQSKQSEMRQSLIDRIQSSNVTQLSPNTYTDHRSKQSFFSGISDEYRREIDQKLFPKVKMTDRDHFNAIFAVPQQKHKPTTAAIAHSTNIGAISNDSTTAVTETVSSDPIASLSTVDASKESTVPSKESNDATKDEISISKPAQKSKPNWRQKVKRYQK